MGTKIAIQFSSKGFAECLEGAADMVLENAERIAEQASHNAPGSAGYRAELQYVPRFQDSQYGVTRPVATGYVIANDDAASIAEAEDKSLSRAVTQ